MPGYHQSDKHFEVSLVAPPMTIAVVIQKRLRCDAIVPCTKRNIHTDLLNQTTSTIEKWKPETREPKGRHVKSSHTQLEYFISQSVLTYRYRQIMQFYLSITNRSPSTQKRPIVLNKRFFSAKTFFEKNTKTEKKTMTRKIFLKPEKYPSKHIPHLQP